jgi:hypothetical protein
MEKMTTFPNAELVLIRTDFHGLKNAKMQLSYQVINFQLNNNVRISLHKFLYRHLNIIV